ncbi:ClpP family protease [Brevibacterium album]|uniref:ClpP family protease n=1 Tax=Brevibacterium album TaxID=417948 RepID=UPI000A016411|nr:ATP-dependent Clp protease proteolytic subunit [Brevibacterium album]
MTHRRTSTDTTPLIPAHTLPGAPASLGPTRTQGHSPPLFADSPADAAPAEAPLTRRLLQRRALVFNGELDDASGMELIAGLHLLADEDPQRDIHLWINSPGGSVPMMLAIADTIGVIPCDVVTVAFGWAASAGQFVLSSGTPGKRLVLPHARVLLHQGSSGIGGTAADVELQADDLRDVRDTVLGRIAALTGRTYAQVFEDSLRDRWFSAQEAVAYGLADALVTDIGQLLSPRPRAAGISGNTIAEAEAGSRTSSGGGAAGAAAGEQEGAPA